MACHTTRYSTGAAATTATLGVLLVGVAQGPTPVDAITGALGAVTAAFAVIGLLRGQRFGARLTAAMLAVVSGGLALVQMVLGPLGSSRDGFSTLGLMVAIASVGTLVLLDRAALHRGAHAFSTRIYAR